jgi:hypothetical protein
VLWIPLLKCWRFLIRSRFTDVLALSQLPRGLLKDEAGLTFLHVSACGENACAVDMGRCKCGWKKQMKGRRKGGTGSPPVFSREFPTGETTIKELYNSANLVKFITRRRLWASSHRREVQYPGHS